ncbi:hypothetical protein [Oxobacter pfennigii]|nr:hypothetical protein [Oxobacter pfennigii]
MIEFQRHLWLASTHTTFKYDISIISFFPSEKHIERIIEDEPSGEIAIPE